MKIKKLLIVGGTGMLGFPVVKKLIEDGYEVDILTRNPDSARNKFGAEYSFIAGDVSAFSSLQTLLKTKNYDGIHINLNAMTYKDIKMIEVEGTANLVKAAKDSNIQKITIISGMGVQERNSWSRFVRLKLEIENLITTSGIPYTIFNCTHFMESIKRYIRNGKISVMGQQPHVWSWIAATDYAKMVSNAYKNEKSNNKIISVLGPEKLTMKQAFQKYINVVDPSLKITEVSLGMLKVIAFITFNDILKYVVDLMTYFEKTPEHPKEGTLMDLLGTPTTTFEEWLTMEKSSHEQN